ncbi:Sterol O-acyltransferase 2 (Sterol-ester synthase 2) [Fusarium falciforme]|nr:Sterol O-acyltransferase 2 (Sterol-ester synthase 2) [Fusarium falciforme]
MLDLAMFLCTFFVVFVHWLVKKRIINWKWTRFVAVSIFELAFIPVTFPIYVYYFDFNWVTRIFLFLHSVVFVMKSHSFAFLQRVSLGHKAGTRVLFQTVAKIQGILVPRDPRDSAKSCDFCLFELNYQTKDNDFPNNISCSNFFMFCLFPVLVYQINYPRTSRIRWRYVLEKVCAIIGTIFLMMVTAQFFMHPVAMRCIQFHNTPTFGG